MAHYQVILAYDGSDFLGFQRQGSGRTVQSEVEGALQRLNWQGRTILFAGRTDSGVHAKGQVVSFNLDWAHSPQALGKALNANLPKDVAVCRISIAGEEFHPRFSARWRRYCYTIYNLPERHPLMDRFALRVWPGARLDLLLEAAQVLIGRHDFSAFGNPPRPGGNPVREVYQADWKEEAETVEFTITANAFLYHMVRRIVYLQLQVGQGRLDLDDLARAVNNAQELQPGLAAPQGLQLLEVGYNKIEI
jgi:tRNA pseudouridine38-40 synthase